MHFDLVRIVSLDNIKQLEETLKKNEGLLEYKDEHGNTLVLLAAANGRLPLLQYLKEHKNLSLITQNNFGCTPLLLAAANGHISIVKYLLENAGVKTTEKNYYGDTAILLAAAYGHISMVKYLLENTSSKITEQNQNGSTPLLAAAAYGHVSMVQYLLENHYASISERSHAGYTVLLIAASYGHTQLVKYLLENTPADIEERSNSGSTALLLAAYNGHISTVKYILHNTNARITECNHQGDTALLLAAYNGQIHMLEYLLSKPEVCLWEKNNNGDNALSLAAWNGHVETVKFLLNKGIPIDLLRKDGRTALEAIQIHDNNATVPVLEAAIQLLNYAEIHPSFSFSLEGILKTLGNALHGCRANSQETALHFAIKNHKVDLVIVLLEHGASIEILNKTGESPLSLALMSENIYLKALLCLAKLKQLSPQDFERHHAPFEHNDRMTPIKYKTISAMTVTGICESRIESKEIKESKTIQMFNHPDIEKYIHILMNILQSPETDLEDKFSSAEKTEICESFAKFLSRTNTSHFQPHLAYEILSKIPKTQLTARHHAMMYELLNTSVHNDLTEDTVSYHLQLKRKIEHLSQSDIPEKSMLLDQLIRDFAGFDIQIMNVAENNLESLFLLLESIRNQRLENKNLTSEMTKQKRDFQEKQRKLELELEKAHNEINKFKDLVLASQAKKLYEREILLTQY